MAGKPKDLRYEEAALWKRIEYVENLKEALTSEGTIFSETVREYTRLMDDIIAEIALEVHRAVKTGADDLKDVHKRLQQKKRPIIREHTDAAMVITSPVTKGVQSSGGTKRSMDMFGNHIQGTAVDLVTCPLCHHRKAAGKFAIHLEKCMGLGRQAGRAATRRISDTLNSL